MKQQKPCNNKNLAVDHINFVRETETNCNCLVFTQHLCKLTLGMKKFIFFYQNSYLELHIFIALQRNLVHGTKRWFSLLSTNNVSNFPKNIQFVQMEKRMYLQIFHINIHPFEYYCLTSRTIIKTEYNHKFMIMTNIK